MKTPAALVALCFLVVRVHAGADFNHHSAIWEKDIAAFERMDQTNPPPKGGIEFIGSSTIARWKTLAQDFPGQPVFNRGFGGSQLADSTCYAPRIIFPYAPRMVLLRAGGNDLWAGETPEDVFSDFKDFVATVHGKLPDTTIVFISWDPTPSRWKQHDKELELNRLVKDYVAQKPEWRLQYIETYDLPLGPDGRPRPELFGPDQLHFNAAGYKLLADRVRPYLAK
jgi:hypothetical protein